MATTFKLYSAAATDGAVYIDLPIGGRLESVSFNAVLTAGAGGIGEIYCEVSRQAVNQVGVNNPRGVIGQLCVATAAASQGKSENGAFFPNEPVKSGERIYLNCAGGSANVAALKATVFLTIA